jgi:hypothetical protein
VTVFIFFPYRIPNGILADLIKIKEEKVIEKLVRKNCIFIKNDLAPRPLPVSLHTELQPGHR